MYTICIFLMLIAVAVLAGAMLFLLSTIVVAMKAGAEAMVDGTTALAHKLGALVSRHPKIPTVDTVPYSVTVRK